MMKRISLALVLLFCSLCALVGYAEIPMNPTAHPLGFPDPAGPVLGKITSIYNLIFWIITVIFFIVAIPMAVILFRFGRKTNPNPAKFSHNTVVEIVWTAIPAVICAVMAYYSWVAMTYVRTLPEDGITIEAVAYQFGWDFYYPDFAENDSHLAAPEPTTPHTLLSSAGETRYTKEIVVPVAVPVKLQVTSQDVIHAFYTPDLGVKIDMIPGRINYAWFSASKAGEFIGQCAELCGSAHGEMFFVIRAVPYPEFVAYINQQRVNSGFTALTAETIAQKIGITPQTATGV